MNTGQVCINSLRMNFAGRLVKGTWGLGGQLERPLCRSLFCETRIARIRSHINNPTPLI